MARANAPALSSSFEPVRQPQPPAFRRRRRRRRGRGAVGRAVDGLRRPQDDALVELRAVVAGVGVVVVERLPGDDAGVRPLRVPREEVAVARADDDLELVIAVDVAHGRRRDDPPVGELRPGGRLAAARVDGVHEVAAGAEQDLGVVVARDVGHGVVDEQRVVLDGHRRAVERVPAGAAPHAEQVLRRVRGGPAARRVAGDAQAPSGHDDVGHAVLVEVADRRAAEEREHRVRPRRLRAVAEDARRIDAHLRAVAARRLLARVLVVAGALVGRLVEAGLGARVRREDEGADAVACDERLRLPGLLEVGDGGRAVEPLGDEREDVERGQRDGPVRKEGAAGRVRAPTVDQEREARAPAGADLLVRPRHDVGDAVAVEVRDRGRRHDAVVRFARLPCTSTGHPASAVPSNLPDVDVAVEGRLHDLRACRRGRSPRAPGSRPRRATRGAPCPCTASSSPSGSAGRAGTRARAEAASASPAASCRRTRRRRPCLATSTTTISGLPSPLTSPIAGVRHDRLARDRRIDAAAGRVRVGRAR